MLPHWQRLIELVQDAFRARKRDANLLDYADLERLTCEVLKKPALRDRFRSEFRQVLVDEFHDTSPLQWQIIRALADPGKPGRLFIVGDPRQSIYAFRGADVRVFDEARRQILKGGGEDISLSHSFRAHQPLLDLLNDHLQPGAGAAMPAAGRRRNTKLNSEKRWKLSARQRPVRIPRWSCCCWIARMPT